MFDRRELLLGAMLTIAVRRSKTHALQDAGGLPEGFVIDESAGPMTPEVMRELRWGRASVITVFSPDEKRVFTARETDDFAQIWDEATRTKLKVLRPFRVEWGKDWVSYSDDGSEILVTAKDGTVRRFNAET